MHSHRSYDAKCSYAELREIFLARGLAFACMTEHIEEMGQAEVDAVFADCERHSDDRFLFIPGFELDWFYVYFLGVRKLAVDFSEHRATYRSFRANAELCVLSHPVKAHFAYPQWVIDDCDAVEVLNVKHDGQFSFRPQSLKLLGSIRRHRPAVVPVAGIDFHAPRQMCGVHMRLERTVPLAAASVLDEIKAGRLRIYDGERSLSDESRWRRAYHSGRIWIMDVAHDANRLISAAGLKPPRALRRWLSRTLEGRG